MRTGNFGGAILVIILMISVLMGGCIVRKESPDLGVAGDYLGQEPPDMKPEIFGPRIVSTGMDERDMAFSHDAREFYFTIWLPMKTGVIMAVKRRDNRWSQPEVASFSGGYSDLEPGFSPDGRRLYFVSNRPLKGGNPPKDYDIWYVERTDSGWSAPVNPGPPLNTDKNEYYPSLAASGALYFTANYEGSEDIYVVRPGDNGYRKPERLGEGVNTDGYEFNAVVSRDESFLIFTSYGRDGALGGGDLYISFRDSLGKWLPAQNMGEAINSKYLDYCPALTPDGCYLFFTSNRVGSEIDSTRLYSLDDVRQFHNLFQNGRGDIYWVDREVIEAFGR